MKTESTIRLPRSLATWSVGIFCSLFASIAFAAPGAIWTTLVNGAKVNSNLYESKDDAYLNGGPNNDTGGSGLGDGTYYFMVTDPSGKVLLSTDPIGCRMVTVANGRIDGVTGTCPHPVGLDTGSGTHPVKLMPYNDTPNGGGEYKVWVAPISAYNPSRANCTFGFCGGDIKTDNFKVLKPAPAYVVACKFNDANNNGTQELGEQTIAHWPITATGVDGGTVSTQTDDTGCATFVISTFPAGTVTVTEGNLGDLWLQTAPTNGPRARDGTTPAYTVTNGVITTSDIKGGDILDIDFGNHNDDCAEPGSCAPPDCIVFGICPPEDPGLTVTKTAVPSYTVLWKIEKSVDQESINTATNSALVNYTVNVTKTGTANHVVTGTITVNNPTIADAEGVTVLDENTNCTLDDAVPSSNSMTGLTVLAGKTRTFNYTCTYESMPTEAGTNKATVTWTTSAGPISASNTATIDFAGSNATVVDGTVKVSDPLDSGSPRTVTQAQSPFSFSYPVTYTVATLGTCETKHNTATLTSTTSSLNLTASKDVTLCVGADLVVTKTATPSFRRVYSWSINKTVDVARIVGGGTAHYTIKVAQTGVSDDSWTVTGSITVSNPNTWQPISFNLADTINNGGICTITGGVGTLAAGASTTANYTCTYTVAPSPAAFTNTATASVTSGITPNVTASGTASGAFVTPVRVNQTVTAVDVMNGNTVTLGTLTGTDAMPFASQTFTFDATFTPPI